MRNDLQTIPFNTLRRVVIFSLETGLRLTTRLRGIGDYPDPMKYFGPGGLPEARRLCAAVNRDPEQYFKPDADAAFRNMESGPELNRSGVTVRDLRFDSPAPSLRPSNDRVQVRLFVHGDAAVRNRVVVFHHPVYQDKWTSWEWFLDPLIRRIPVAIMTAPNHYERREPDEFPGEWTINPNPYLLYQAIRQWCWDQQAASNLLREEEGLEPAAVAGFSVGAFQSTLLAALGHLDLPLISMATTSRYAFGLLNGVTGHRVVSAMAEAGIEPAMLEEMADALQLERYAHRLRGRDVLLIRGLYDRVDPPPSLARLEEAMLPKRVLHLPAGHGTLLLHRRTIMEEILLFLENLGFE